ncbi:hypothetical protein [Hydrogenovibrio marinus]|uniref:Uncharacterized protein n=1 Tax=Hydrogenovibrio marinus TaxID=28885 RepID=A0A067A1Z2_HYDMR|nr:hypothetical protein [Hydrogenovibrio marinus]KDN96385.1 hypothetical protein EI16_08930 [Hydrogenovibrio marinus]BBN60421.1 hypothetical protein HVMH_2015 [Hydrogenovibrio marinus]
MAIDLRRVEPLGSKSVLLEQALRRHKGSKDMDSDIDMSDMVTPDYQWLNEDKTALKSLVAQMDASIGQLSKQMKDLENESEKVRMKMDKEQQLLFKQIRTLNNLLKNQVTVFSSVERQVEEIELRSNNTLSQVGIGLVSGLIGAVTILVSAPWMTLLMEHLRG